MGFLSKESGHSQSTKRIAGSGSRGRSKGRRHRRGGTSSSSKMNTRNSNYHDMMFVEVANKSGTDLFAKSPIAVLKSRGDDGFPSKTKTKTKKDNDFFAQTNKEITTRTKAKASKSKAKSKQQQKRQNKSRSKSPSNMEMINNTFELLAARAANRHKITNDWSANFLSLDAKTSEASSSYDDRGDDNNRSRSGQRTKIRTRASIRSRSYDPVIIKSKMSSSSSISASHRDHKRTRPTRSSSPSKYREERSRSGETTRSRRSGGGMKEKLKQKNSSSSKSISSSSKIKKEGSSNNNNNNKNKRAEAKARLTLNKDMTILADGINLDHNSRLMLAAYDARTLDDFYLMADTDFRDLIKKARLTHHSLPALQIRKIRKLRRWLKEIIEENMQEQLQYDTDGSTSCRRTRTCTDKYGKQQLVPHDWKKQYQNDLPFMKMQLRQQGDSIVERFEYISSVIGCGMGSTGSPQWHCQSSS